jgi:PAS domain S-box-containing protein
METADMIFPWSPVVFVDMVGPILTFVLALLCANNALLWQKAKPNDIFRHYIFMLTLTFVLFAVSRSFGHLLKQILALTGLEHVWLAIAPFSGAVNTVTFVIMASFSLYFNRLQKVHDEVEKYKSGLEHLVEERTHQLEEVNVALETVLNSANPICMMSLDFEIVKANKAYYDIWPRLAGAGEVLKCFESRPGPACGTDGCPVTLIRQGTDEVVNQFSKELANGRMGEFIVTARPYRDVNGKIVGVVESFQDITAQSDVAKQLLAEREQLNVTLRSIGDGVITTDTVGNIVLMNKVAEKITGWSQAEAVGRQLVRVFNVIDRDSDATFEHLLGEICAPGSATGSAPKKMVTKDGVERLVSESGALIRDRESKVAGAVLVFRDITEKIKTDEELSKLGKLESVGVLAGGIAHDFNNILTAILGNISLAMLRSKSEEGVYELLAAAEKASIRAKNLTQQLLTFAKGGEPVKNIAPIQEIIKESADFVLRGGNVDCAYVFADDLWGVDVDTGQISQVIQNIILNAAAAMPEGGTVTVTCANYYNKKDSLFLKAGCYVKGVIADQGVGIAADQLGKIFDPFFTTKKAGSGLGLAITHSIITNHGGHIEVESKPGVGTTFTFYLPASGEMVAAPTKSEFPVNNVKDKGRIMVMDDDAMIRNLVESMLESLGYEALTARDGDEAVRLYREAMANGESIAAIIMDLTIPGGVGGREAVQEIHKIDPAAKVIVSSGYSNDPIMADYLDYGFCAAIVKPFKLQEFHEVISRVLG